MGNTRSSSKLGQNDSGDNQQGPLRKGHSRRTQTSLWSGILEVARILYSMNGKLRETRCQN